MNIRGVLHSFNPRSVHCSSMLQRLQQADDATAPQLDLPLTAVRAWEARTCADTAKMTYLLDVVKVRVI